VTVHLIDVFADYGDSPRNCRYQTR
jgi:hypothetical protein